MNEKKVYCKHCKCEIFEFRKKVSHVDDYTVIGKQIDVQGYKICNCGCNNPEK